MSQPMDDMWLSITKGNELLGDVFVLMAFNGGIVDGRQRQIVEIGTLRGLSAIILSANGAHVTTIDSGQLVETGYNEYAPTPHEVVQKYLSLYEIDSIKGMSTDVAETWENNSVDTLFIDASHGYDNVSSDYHAWVPKVRLGGHIIFHDVSPVHEGVWKFYNQDLRKLVSEANLREVPLPNLHGCGTVCKVFQRLV